MGTSADCSMSKEKKELFEESIDSVPDDEFSEGFEAFEQKGKGIEAEAREEEELAGQELMDRQQSVDVFDPREEIEPTRAALKDHIDRIVMALASFSQRRCPGVSRAFYIDTLKEELHQYYSYNEELVDIIVNLLGPEQAVDFMEASEVRRPLTLRVNTLRAKRRDVAQALIARGAQLDPIGAWCPAGLQVFESQVALGATPEYLLGHYMIQGAASFIPVEVLAPQPNTRVADLCAAPGGKTTHIAQKMRNTGVLYANDVSRERLTAVVANSHRMGVTNCVCSCMDARKFPVKELDYILVDAPCTGLGVVAADPMIKLQVKFNDLTNAAHLQREILMHALELLKVGGTLVYSTCSISLEENEAVVDFALRRCGHSIEVQDFSQTIQFGAPGFVRHGTHRFHQSLSNTRRFYPHTHNLDGFFVAKIVKRAPLPDGANCFTPKPAKEQATKPAEEKTKREKKTTVVEREPEEFDSGSESESAPASETESGSELPSSLLEDDGDNGSDIPSDEALQKPEDRAVIQAIRTAFQRLKSQAAEHSAETVEKNEEEEESDDSEGQEESSEENQPKAGQARRHRQSHSHHHHGSNRHHHHHGH